MSKYFHFTYNWQAQKQEATKGPSTNSVVPTWSRPAINQDSTGQKQHYDTSDPGAGGAWGRARPLKIWRKRLDPQNSSGGGRAGVGIPSDVPGGSVYLGTEGHNCLTDCSGTMSLKNNIIDNGRTFSQGTTLLPRKQPEKDEFNKCISCDPESNVIKSAQISTKYKQKKYYPDTKAYLRSRCRTYKQNLPTGNRIPGVEYFNEYTDPNGVKHSVPANPDDTKNGPQNFFYNTSDHLQSGECIQDPTKPKTVSRLVYKPSNSSFAHQGAVSSGTRLLKLKADTVNTAASNLTAWGKAAENAGKYNGNPNAPYFLKTKYADCVERRLPGNHTICSYTPSSQIGAMWDHSLVR